MGYPACVIPVMIASPSDVKEEVSIIKGGIWDWNAINSSARKVVLVPVTGSSCTSPEMGNRPQELINRRVLKECDLLIAIFGTRCGSPTGRFDSGTVEEILEHHKSNKHTMVYFSSAPVPPDLIYGNRQYGLLLEFKEKCKNMGIIREFSSMEELRAIFTNDLAITLINSPYIQSVIDQTLLAPAHAIPSQPRASIISDEALTLLKEASKARQNLILATGALSDVTYNVGERTFGNDSPRESARWTQAIEELVGSGMLKVKGRNGDIFFMTDKGWKYLEEKS